MKLLGAILLVIASLLSSAPSCAATTGNSTILAGIGCDNLAKDQIPEHEHEPTEAGLCHACTFPAADSVSATLPQKWAEMPHLMATTSRSGGYSPETPVPPPRSLVQDQKSTL